MNKLFLEVILAPKFSKKALKIFSSKKNLRLLQVKMPKTKMKKFLNNCLMDFYYKTRIILI